MNFRIETADEVIRAALGDAIEFENGKALVNDGNAVVVKTESCYKCVLKDIADFDSYVKKLNIAGDTVVYGKKPRGGAFTERAHECLSFAYLGALPPPLRLPTGVEIKRLAPTLAKLVSDTYRNSGGGYTEAETAALMRDKGVFGAFTDSKLAGFIGRHADGSIGMLHVFDGFRRRGIGEALETFMINYVMTFGRVPLCDVYCGNSASMALQTKLGMTAARCGAFWTTV